MMSMLFAALRPWMGLLFLALACALAIPVSASSGYKAPAAAAPERAGLWLIHDHLHDEPPFMERVQPPSAGMLIVVRHADRDRNETDLNATGRARARALPEALSDLPLDAIYMTGYRRNADTAAPLSAARGLEPQVLAPDETLSTTLVAAAEGRSVLWIGNVGNLVDLWEALGLGGAAPTTYGQIAVLVAKEGVWQVARRSFDGG